MALINCKECSKEISDSAASCPNCGCPIMQPQHQQSLNIQHNPIEIKKAKEKAFISLILGIITICCMMSVMFYTYIMIVGLITSIIGALKGDKARRELSKYDQPIGVAVAGIIMGVIGLVGPWIIII